MRQMALIRHARKEDAAGIARVHVDSWRTTYDGIIKQPFLKSLSYEEKEKRWQDYFSQPPENTVLYVAEKDDQIVGFISGGPVRDGVEGAAGELYAVYILEEYQRRGIGQRLLAALVQELKARKLNNLFVWVLKDNPSASFYRKLGAKEWKEASFELAGQSLAEIGLLWDDLEVLKEKLALSLK
ncbi:GNAT family N-acetyltransferase [Halalkalibacterium halodurans]|uniref:N-acetyltransferase domain-containing protein n=2 Tax=Halalkalibacterium halodurans TaxID=86665 RepID=A0A0M0KKT0_ALKHA|nr:GNAT family N-acetyltransferase [Halalkalibacterium halodurans]TPE68798.1 GNAT family N-acetyltransferase [Halalkalibacterium halodurans]